MFFHPNHAVPAVKFVSAVFKNSYHSVVHFFVELNTGFCKKFIFSFCIGNTSITIQNILFFKKKLPISLCVALSSVMLFDWGIQYLKIKESTNIRRLVTGLIGGFGYTTLHLHFYCYIFFCILYKKINK